ncbi:MAG TPA: TetR/AcrR family transcriptional regulator [Streptosporangiaceae bacterium]|nr:TetR/AcrR family transcriptional regulator [Streptosporangiaceae bacterium]
MFAVSSHQTSPDRQSGEPGGRGRGGDKRRALLDGALAVFSADGYSRASVDNIARAAGVSTRTLYNHFGDKAALFEAVIVDSAQRVAAAQVITVQRLLGRIADIEADLTEFGRVWATPSPQYAAHFALVRQITADADHIPPAALEAWQQAGPLRVRAEIADHLRRIAQAGHLSIDDPETAAVHLIQLVMAGRTFHGPVAPPTGEIHRLADAGVRAFLHGYAAARAPAARPGRGRR